MCVADVARPPENAGRPDWFERAIAMAPHTQRVTTSGKEIEVLSWGDPAAPGLMLLHGSMAHARWWSFIAPFFTARFHVVALSFSGMGGSSHAPPPYTIEAYAEEAMAVADALQLGHDGRRFAVAAHSAGGGVAAVMAADHGERLDRAILIDSLIAPGEARPTQEPDRPFRIYTSRAEAIARYRLVPPQPERNRFLIDWVAEHALVPVAGGWQWNFDPWLRGRFHARSAWDHVARARCPLIVISGENSAVVTRERLDALRARIPAARFLTIADAHHHVLIDQPLGTVAALTAALDLAPETSR